MEENTGSEDYKLVSLILSFGATKNTKYKKKKKYTHRQKPTKTNKATRKTTCILIQIHRDFFSSDYFIQVSETCCRESNIQYSYKVFDKSETDKKS